MAVPLLTKLSPRKARTAESPLAFPNSQMIVASNKMIKSVGSSLLQVGAGLTFPLLPSQPQSHHSRPVLKKQESDKTVDLSEGEFGNLCRQLDDNDDDVRSVTLGEPGLTAIRAIQLGGCLEKNTKVDTVTIDFAYVKTFCGSMFSFVKYIENSKSLRTVVLANADMSDLKVCSALLVVLPAIAKNRRITDFELRSGEKVYRNIFVAFWYAIIHALFGGSSTISMLQSSVAYSLAQCEDLESVVLAYLPESFNCQILPELENFQSLYSLTFIPRNYTAETLEAMTSLVRNSMSLQTLKLEGFQFNSGNFLSLAEGLVETISVKNLSFTNCTFGSTSTQMVEDVATTMRKVSFAGNVKFSRSSSKVMNTIVGREDDNSLKELDLTSYSMKAKNVTRFLQGIETSGGHVLQKLSLPKSAKSIDVKDVQAAVSRMPSLKEVHIVCEDLDMLATQQVVSSLQANTTMTKCSINGEEFRLQRELKEEKSFSFRSDSSQQSMRRSRKLRKELSSEELIQLNKREELQRSSKAGMAAEASAVSSDDDTEEPYQSHRERMMETMKRHRLSERVLEVLNNDKD